MKTFILALLLLLPFFPATAQDAPTFRLPIDCTPGTDCWVLNYVDVGPPDDGRYTDHTCNARSYDGHKGTDFALRSQAEMDKGVAVLAARDGTVKRIRDGETDRFPTKEDMKAVKEARRECGNAVLIDHGSGLQTLYCHLKKGSVRVKPEQDIKAGDPIAEVGLSGFTEFPHVHFGILWEGAVVDPFTGMNNTEACGGFKRSLWNPSVKLQYQPMTLYDGALQDRVPDFDAIERGASAPEKLTTAAEALVFWFAMLGAREGDQIIMTIKKPDGALFSRRVIEQPKTRARQYYYTGKKISDEPLIPGTYTGNVQVKRTLPDGQIISRDLNRDIVVE